MLLLHGVSYIKKSCSEEFATQLAKLMKTAELQRKPDGDEFIGEFFLFWFFFVGIWILQPRINKMFEQEELD